ncbi:hypothetical protein BU23DRAFT_436690, partial [Bimuria novae-zelandiae CBS 107.79]
VKLWNFGDAPNDIKGTTFTKLTLPYNGGVPALEDPNTNTTSSESGACINDLLRTYNAHSTGG